MEFKHTDVYAKVLKLSHVIFYDRFISNNYRKQLLFTEHIKTSGSELRGQEEAACMRVIGLCDHYSELFTRMEALKF